MTRVVFPAAETPAPDAVAMLDAPLAAVPLPTAATADITHLIAAAKAGRPGALGELLNAVHGYLLATAARRIAAAARPHLAPSDVVQETAIEVQQGFASFHGTSAPELLAWLRGILVHNVSDAMRRGRAYDRALVRSTGDRPPRDDDGRSPAALARPTEASAIRRDDAALVTRVLESLGEEARAVVRLRYWDGLSFVEIGQRLGRTDNAVRKIWFRAVARLQHELRAIGS